MNADEIIKALRWEAEDTEFVFAAETMNEAADLIESLQAQLEQKTNEAEGMRSNWYKCIENLKKALNRRAQPENEPLTLEELRQMDGEPVYVVTLDNPLENQPYWAIAGINSNDSRHQIGVALYNRVQGDWGAFDLYGDTWLAYRTKPERSEG